MEVGLVVRMEVDLVDHKEVDLVVHMEVEHRVVRIVVDHIQVVHIVVEELLNMLASFF